MKKTIIKFIFGLIILPVSIVGVFYYLNRNGFFNIENIEVVIEESPVGQEQYLNPNVEGLKKSLVRFKGQSLWNIKLNSITKEISDTAWIESSKIHRNWPATLTLKLKPYEVKLLFMNKQGKLFPIIKDGTLLLPVDSKQAPDVAILEGESFLKNIELRQKAVMAFEQIPVVGSFSKKTISEVGYDQKEGFWMTLVKSGVKVKMGEDLVSIKAARVGQVVDYLEKHQFQARVIDANLSKKVLVSLRKGP